MSIIEVWLLLKQATYPIKIGAQRCFLSSLSPATRSVDATPDSKKERFRGSSFRHEHCSMKMLVEFSYYQLTRIE